MVQVARHIKCGCIGKWQTEEAQWYVNCYKPSLIHGQTLFCHACRYVVSFVGIAPVITGVRMTKMIVILHKDVLSMLALHLKAVFFHA